MRLCEILASLTLQTEPRCIELARSVPPHDPQRLLAYVGHVEVAAETGNAAAVEMLALLDDMLRALVAAGVDGRIVARGLVGAGAVPLEPSHWLVLAGLAAEELRRAIDLGHDRIRLPGETTWADTEWDRGETRWDFGLPATDVAAIDGVMVCYADTTSSPPAPPPPLHWHDIALRELQAGGSPAGKPGGWKSHARGVRTQMPKAETEKLSELQIVQLDQAIIRFGQRHLARQRKSATRDKSDR